MKRKGLVTVAVKTVIDGYSPGYRYHGNELKENCVQLYPELTDTYLDSFQRMMRRHRRYAYRVIDKNNSLYEKLRVKTVSEEMEELKKAAEKKRKPQKVSFSPAALQLPLFCERAH